MEELVVVALTECQALDLCDLQTFVAFLSAISGTNCAHLIREHAINIRGRLKTTGVTMFGRNELTTYGPESEDSDLGSDQERPSAVLLVARNQTLNDTCRRKLSDAGINVVLSTPSSDKALELIDNNHLFDAVVIGIDAGDVEGVKLARHLSQFRRDTPTLVMSPMANLQVSGVGETKPLENLGKLKSAVARCRLRRGAYR